MNELETVIDAKLLSLKRVQPLLNEPNELTAILVATRRTAKDSPIENRKSKIENSHAFTT